MEKMTSRGILLNLLYAALNASVPDPVLAEALTDGGLAQVYALAKRHDLGHIVSQVLYDGGLCTDEALRQRCQRDAMMAVYRCEQLKYALEEIGAVLDEAGIAYIPLKGAVIRPYYPGESMRTSCDVDVLVHEDDVEAAVTALVTRGQYRYGKRCYHDVDLYSPTGIHLELHFNILENHAGLDAVLKQAWDYATPTQGSRCEFSKEFFVFHMYAHMAYHFLFGGCGVRSLMDVWVMEHNMNMPYLCAEELLKQAGIDTFAAEMSRLANRCFTENDPTAEDDAVLQYIMTGGVYGSAENHITLKKAETKRLGNYVLKRLFLPFSSMTILYPFLKKAPVLLPACWVARWGQALFGGKSKRVLSELSYAGAVSDEKVADVKSLCTRLGL